MATPVNRAVVDVREGSWPLMREAWISAGYVMVAVAFAFVPDIGIEWRSAPESPMVSGSIVAAVLLGLAHLFRKRIPVAVIVIGAAILLAEAVWTGTTSIGVILIECDAIYNLVTVRSTPRTWRLLPVIAAACLSLAVVGLLLANVLAASVLQATILLLAVGVTLWWGMTVRIPMNEAIHERERAFLLAEAAEASQREVLTAARFQISRELHDAISGHLSAIAMQSAAVTAAPEPPDATELTAHIRQMRILSLEAMADMRALIDVLRTEESGPIASPRTWSSVGELLDHVISAGTPVTVTGDAPQSAVFDPPVAVAAYNVVHEGLVNAAKHAPGADVVIDMTNSGDEFEIMVTNRCVTRGPGDSPNSGYGLIGLAERVRLCGGRIDSEQSHRSWTLRALLPQSAGREVNHA
ncbi:sensor histidine kinase [Brevibacterium aurantiacum]|uniref:histidine kinase n=1 Tax=Brevibacterium aurantiacum TaxID=273384 RepID=A0A556CK28_BREAU|nr:histidine kinase [Brevibacterium aurantiacum]TSI17787.1 hypothetical protein FO013_06230 [Brevibacterium aurantiacum]